jgi:proteasome accessory factor PafA2
MSTTAGDGVSPDEGPAAPRTVCGIETEYGITITGQEEFNPVLASSLLINSYADAVLRRVRWDFEDEHPDIDARGIDLPAAAPPEVETHLVNVVLTNGARYYVDHAHPEYSSPEVASAHEALLYDKAGEAIVAASVRAAQDTLPPGERIAAYKNNSDGKGNSYGCHENYLIDRGVPFSRIVACMLPFFVSRQVVCGAGKVGAEHGQAACDFQISSRADFFEEEVGLETTLKRPIVNTRDEPHADPARWRRLHVIVGDANMSEVSTLLKLGTTSLVLHVLEATGEMPDATLLNPVAAIHAVSHDPTCRRVLRMADGRAVTPVELQWDYYELVAKYCEPFGDDLDPGHREVLRRWYDVLSALEDDPMRCDGVLDWPTKLAVLEAYRDRGGLAWDDPRLRLIDLQYHDVNPDKGLAYTLMRAGKLERILDAAAVADAVTEPPTTTRAYFRGRCLEKYPDAVVSANWDSMVFDTGADALRRVPMLDPLRGTEEIVGELLERSATAGELLDALGA